MQARCLPLIESRFAFGVVTDENLAESRIESFDMRCEVLAVLEVELFLPARVARLAVPFWFIVTAVGLGLVALGPGSKKAR